MAQFIFSVFPCQLTPSYSPSENSLSLGICPKVAKDYYHLCRCSQVSGQPTLFQILKQMYIFKSNAEQLCPTCSLKSVSVASA